MINLTDEEIEELLGEPEVMIRMKCKKCGYEKNVPKWILEEFLKEEMYSGKENHGYSCQCPKCNGTMVRKKIISNTFLAITKKLDETSNF